MNNDLISRNDLIQHAFTAEFDGKSIDVVALTDVDNAPTVEPQKVPIANVTFDTEKLKELTDEIVERIKSGEIVLQDERPKGEWIEYKEDNEIRYYCSNCLITKGQAVNCFCASCGADMRGDKE